MAGFLKISCQLISLCLPRHSRIFKAGVGPGIWSAHASQCSIVDKCRVFGKLRDEVFNLTMSRALNTCITKSIVSYNGRQKMGKRLKRVKSEKEVKDLSNVLAPPQEVEMPEAEISGEADDERWRSVKQKMSTLTSNAQRRSQQMQYVGCSLGVDFGEARTGVSISLGGYAPRPLVVLQARGDILIEELLNIANKEKADEFIVGLPLSFEGKETLQSTKTRSFAGRLAGLAALRGWRVFLQDEYGTSKDGVAYMLDLGVKKRRRKEMQDAYAAAVLLSTYFNSYGSRANLMIPKGLHAQERLCLETISSAQGNINEEDNYNYDD